jgi:Family of unknown function (DUF6279)
MMTMSSAMLMQWMVRRRIIAVVLAFALPLALLSGCSTLRLAYNQAPDLAYWWLDGYADFDGEQTPRVRAALAEGFAWHRATQLRDYADLLAQVRREGQGELLPAQICAWSDATRQRIERAVDRLAPAAAEIVLTLKPEQIQHIERRMRKGHDEFRSDYLQPSPVERAAGALKRTVERAESFYGPLDDRQRQLLAGALAGSPFDADAWFAERQAVQQQALQQLRRLLAERADAAAAQAALRTWFSQSSVSPRPTYRAYQLRLTSFNCTLAAQLHNTTTAAQRKRAADKLKGWEDDLRQLAAQPAAAAL